MVRITRGAHTIIIKTPRLYGERGVVDGAHEVVRRRYITNKIYIGKQSVPIYITRTFLGIPNVRYSRATRSRGLIVAARSFCNHSPACDDASYRWRRSREIP